MRSSIPFVIILFSGLLCGSGCTRVTALHNVAAMKTWVADNGNGTFSNPLFYEEFSDPDIIRVGEDYYLTGTTMHTMPGLPVLHSKDLVNWELASYAFDRLNLAPSFRLEGAEIYGQGIWAPCIRHHNGTFYIFSNINNHGTQVYRSNSAKGPWKHNVLATTLYDLSVLFDDTGKIYAVCGVNEISLVELNAELTDVVPNTRRVIIPRGRGMGEGLHFYKINGKYYIVTALPGANTPMACARADSLDGPWEIETLVTGESQGVGTGYRLRNAPRNATTFNVIPPDINQRGGLTIHQGGIVDTPSGQWWSVIMQDHNSVGRVSCLAPITWTDGWPLLGLPGNLRKSPKVWIKPDTGHLQEPKPLFVRDDNFDSGSLNPLWQWNHLPDETKWSLREKPGSLRLHSLPAQDFWWARNTLTQRSVGPESTVTVELDASATKPGDVAGLALLNSPYAWIGFTRNTDGTKSIQRFDQISGKTLSEPINHDHFWLRVHCNFDTEQATFSYSADGKSFVSFGDPFTTIFQLRTFQGVRYSLFHYNTGSSLGGYVDFDNYTVDEPRSRGLTLPIPIGKTIELTSAGDGAVLTLDRVSRFRVLDRGKGRIALQSLADSRLVSVTADAAVVLKSGSPSDSETFQWIDMQQRGEIMLMSLTNHRYLIAPPNAAGPIMANHTVPRPDGKDGSCFTWKIIAE